MTTARCGTEKLNERNATYTEKAGKPAHGPAKPSADHPEPLTNLEVRTRDTENRPSTEWCGNWLDSAAQCWAARNGEKYGDGSSSK